MQFEGEHKSILLRGIERAAKNSVVKDGAMNEVIGMIPRDGCLVPYSPVDRGLNTANDVIMARVHHTSTGDNMIIVRKSSFLVNGKDVCETIKTSYKETYIQNGYCGRTIKTTTTEKTITREDRTIKDIVFVGNRMDILTEENGIEHWLWKNGEYENVNDLGDYTNGNGEAKLPSVDFKVRRGIYDGKDVYESAKFVRVEDNFCGASVKQESKDDSVKYASSTEGIKGDVLNVLDSVRYKGGITGYILVAAAYHVKGSDASNPQYIMASPIMLMGAPEIYMKDNMYETSECQYQEFPVGTYMLDMFNYSNRTKKWDVAPSQEQAFDKLWAMVNTDEAGTEDLVEGEKVGLEMQLVADPCRLRRIVETDTKKYTESYKADKQLYVKTSNQQIQQPALVGQKYALYNHLYETGTIDPAAGTTAFRGIMVTHASANVLSFRVNGEVAEKYKDEVDKLCIFISPIISPYKHTSDVGIVMKSNYQSTPEKYDGFFFCEKVCASNYKMHKSACGGSFTPEMKSASEIRKDIENVAGLYTAAALTIQFTDIKPNKWVDLDLSGGILESDKLVQHTDTMIKISDLKPVNITTGGIFGYNERLHVYNFQKKEVYRMPYRCLPYFYGKGQYSEKEGNILYEYSVEVRDSNDSLICSRFDSYCPALNPLVCHNDIKAKKIKVVKRYKKGTVFYAGEKEYDPIQFASIASGYLQTDLKPLNLACKEVTIRQYDAAFSEDQIEADSESYGANEMRVSQTGSIVFEVDKSYKIGNGKIKALARMTMGLSQDNYGKYPLVIFCTDGIYTLDVDSTGAGAYNMQSPLSRLICTNVHGICEIDGAVLFPTEKGLHIVTTDGVKPVALHANGMPQDLPSKNNGLEIYRNAITHKKIVQLWDDVSREDFLTYINAEDKGNTGKGTYIRYLHTLNSVICYNRDMPYSYLIELSNWTVTKIIKRIMFDDNDFPKQTFWISPEIENVVALEIDDEEVQEDGTIKTITRYSTLENIAADTIDGEALLRSHLQQTITTNLETRLNDTNTAIEALTNQLKEEQDSAASYESLTDADFAGSETTRAEFFQEASQIQTDINASIAELQTTRTALLAAMDVSYGAEKISDEDEKTLKEVGLESVNATIANQQNKSKLDAKKRQLVDEQIATTIGVIDSAKMCNQFGVGKLTLTKEDGLWKVGSNLLTDERLQECGLTTKQDAADGTKYQITTVNNNNTAVQFDYQIGKENIECLLQTRPINLDTTHLKTAYRVVLRGAFEKTNDDIVITSVRGQKFNILNSNKLATFCDGEDKKIYYVNKIQSKIYTYKGGKTHEKITYSWQWQTEDGTVVRLQDIGIEQLSSVKKADTVTIKLNQHYAGLYVFGSLDGNNWTLIGAKEKLLSSNRFHNLGVETHRVSVRYMLLVFAGYLSQDSHIDGLEITNNVKYNDKLK